MLFFQRGDGRLLCCIRTAGDAARNPIWDTFGGMLTEADIHEAYTTNGADTSPHAFVVCARRLLESQVDLPGSWTLATEAAFGGHIPEAITIASSGAATRDGPSPW